MKRRPRGFFFLGLGLLLLCAGLWGLYTGPSLVQYAFQPAAEQDLSYTSALSNLRDTLGDTFEPLTFHGIKSGTTLTAGERSRNDGVLYLVGPAYNEVYPRRFVCGRPISSLEAAQGAAVCVLDEETAFDFFGAEGALGKTVRLKERDLEVVGVVAHSRRTGETGAWAVWTPMTTGAACDLMVVSAPGTASPGLLTSFRKAAAETFGTGELISLPRERVGATLLPRWVGLLFALWLLKRFFGWLLPFSRERFALIRQESTRRYPARLIPFAAAKLLLPFLLTALALGACWGLAVLAVAPAYTFPDWIPESLGDFSSWAARFWTLTGQAAAPAVLQTPELAETRLCALGIRAGTVILLLGLIRLLLSRQKKPEAAQASGRS